ncbi:EXS family-domain-containing protein [Biscogniauxia mediterranea]|nr:EXS family-domain-containing protein [Biscogniauxia mediterranea]
MKFAKELEHNHVPEWRIKYLNYKSGKSYIKAVSRAINRANATPHSISRRPDLPPLETSTTHGPGSLSNQHHATDHETYGPLRLPPKTSSAPLQSEQESLTRSPGDGGGGYGSIVPTPSTESPLDSQHQFELPAPAIHVPSTIDEDESPRTSESLRKSLTRLDKPRTNSMDPALENTPKSPPQHRPGSSTQHAASPGRLRRMLTSNHYLTRTDTVKIGQSLQPLDVVRMREKEFFDFLDSELDKVESFYRQKEEQAGTRLAALREQLHEMRNRRSQELAEAKQNKEYERKRAQDDKAWASAHDSHQSWIDPIKSKIFKPGANSEALFQMASTPVVRGRDARRDYVRRPTGEVPYRTAKRKLKLALQEFYRGLELLKSYTILNRTAFRKLNKKYDKVTNARPAYRYMNEKVNKSWFVNSDVVDNQIRTVEDLYARYFERGNHKIAVGKLRQLNRRPRDESSNAFLNGLCIGTGAVFTLQGLVYGSKLLFQPDLQLAEQTSYLLQIYAGYFLMLLLFFLFCVNCRLWTANKINYPFIFEFDTRHDLDWRQLVSFPSFFFLLFGLIFWFNFTRLGSDRLFLYYPIILVGITLLIIFLPAPILWHRSRRWFAYSHWRLFFAGFYPVEFRDLFFGDMYCSLAYATANVELFFCIYAHDWNNPTQCNSSRSRLMGFFSALPPIWRALQCLRRYHDTRDIFPHLVNFGKYLMTIVTAIMLSVYRINGTDANLALYITVATINAIYSSIWDLFMDFSFLQPDARYRYLRNMLGFKQRWIYYCIMVIDPILRFGWIFYAIFTYSKQHNTLVSFLVALSEIIRRAMWALIRIENEHCGNVAQYKASRDVPLPYQIQHEPLIERASGEDLAMAERAEDTAAAVDIAAAGASARIREETATGEGVSQPQPQTPSPHMIEGLLRRKNKGDLSRARSIRGIMAEAHRRDFEKKRPPPEPVVEHPGGDSGDDNDEEEDENTNPTTPMDEHAGGPADRRFS